MHLYMPIPLYSHCYTANVSALKGPSLGTTDTFHEQGQQNTCPDVNVWKSKHILSINTEYNIKGVYT